jgi:DNA-binding Xre family transcriptional regulator
MCPACLRTMDRNPPPSSDTWGTVGRAMSNRPQLIGERIRELRGERNWLQRGFSRRAGLTVRTIDRIECGEADVRMSTLTKIATALGCHTSDLMGTGGGE